MAANTRLRDELVRRAEVPVRYPAPSLCTDNAAMIAATAWWRLQSDGPTPLDDGIDPTLPLT